MNRVNGPGSARPHDPKTADGKPGVISAGQFTEEVTYWLVECEGEQWTQVMLVHDAEWEERSAWIVCVEGSWTVWARFDVYDSDIVGRRIFETSYGQIVIKGCSIEWLYRAKGPDGHELVIHPMMTEWFPKGFESWQGGCGDPPQSLMGLVSDRGLKEARGEIGHAFAKVEDWRRDDLPYRFAPGRPKRFYEENRRDAEIAKLAVVASAEKGRGEWSGEFAKLAKIEPGSHQAVIDRLVKNDLLERGGQPYKLTLKARTLLNDWS